LGVCIDIVQPLIARNRCARPVTTALNSEIPDNQIVRATCVVERYQRMDQGIWFFSFAERWAALILDSSQ
jgi:hypothetical protein